jgi:aldose 1-epimerase
MSIIQYPFGQTKSGKEVTQFLLSNGQGMAVSIVNYGATVTGIWLQEARKSKMNMVLGYDTLREYEEDTFYLGCVVGRFANRIANGRFVLNGKAYVLAQNNGVNHLHGGVRGFNKQVWSAEVVENGVRMGYISRDGEEGYAGILHTTVTYTLTPDNALHIHYHATTSAPTIINLTNHSYFNLAGGRDILGHELMLKASQFTPVNDNLIPTGELQAVTGTPFDFRVAKKIGRDIAQPDVQLETASGYDHNWVLDSQGDLAQLSARVVEPSSGRMLEMFTTQPAVQFYTGNFLLGRFAPRSGFCLETQHFPDSPNHPIFPTVVLTPDDVYAHTTIYRFSHKNSH